MRKYQKSMNTYLWIIAVCVRVCAMLCRRRRTEQLEREGERRKNATLILNRKSRNVTRYAMHCSHSKTHTVSKWLMDTLHLREDNNSDNNDDGTPPEEHIARHIYKTGVHCAVHTQQYRDKHYFHLINVQIKWPAILSLFLFYLNFVYFKYR